jgi:acetyltransferase-like isoleucine patch superfamily enzyme
MWQGATDNGPITIGEGSWIGRNCLVYASIGKHSVVAANSFVNKDVPDYCVVAGNPAKIIKRYNPETKTWQRCV